MAKLSNTIQTLIRQLDDSTTQQLNNSSTISSTTSSFNNSELWNLNSNSSSHHKLNYYGISWNPGNPKSENGET
jgi:hypothetical protein